jgi:hypothetical protein
MQGLSLMQRFHGLYFAHGERTSKSKHTAFGKRLYALCQQVGLSQQERGAKLGLSQWTYAHWEVLPSLRKDRSLPTHQQAVPLKTIDTFIKATDK